MIRLSWLKSEAARYAIYGAAFGLLFPILATYIDIERLRLDLSWKSVVFVQKQHPIHFIIDTAPFFLSIFAMFGGLNLDRLRDKNEQILATSKLKQDFLANMSHEIRTPMVGIIGMIDLLSKNTRLDKLQEEYVKTIHQSSFNLLDIVNQILDLSKMEEGKLDLSSGHINFKNLMNQNLHLFLPTATEKNIDLTLNYCKQLPENILADSNRLSQILSNLISNAIKFTENGNIHMNATRLSQEDKKVVIKVEIIDSGIGISKKDQEALFNRYTQFNTNSINYSVGSGLGLSICKKLVNLMQGEIGVKSAPNSGSTFWFTFVAHCTDSSLVEKTKINSEKPNYNLHILLVEDSEINIVVSQQILKYLGCTTDVARDGIEAIQMFEENKYDLILMDINLPKLDGIETCNVIRKRYTNIPPIIAITSNALAGDSERYIAKGLDDCITKPFTTETLNTKLQNWFGNHLKHH
ncbi:ATP-binding protein [Aquimarina pacifica]|uniref:ATP-binding protein n=1 Tax=Aquimarina pacifica TaxID=1296415 RepID=UPI000472050E|nr:ATP-binding protein [Aquimarina pacifica]